MNFAAACGVRPRPRTGGPETFFFPDTHRPPLGHEYQFDLDKDSGRLFLKRMLAFLQRRLETPQLAG
jgi:hypothetical protein